MIKEGDKVICIKDDEGFGIEKNKSYNIWSIDDGEIRIDMSDHKPSEKMLKKYWLGYKSKYCQVIPFYMNEVGRESLIFGFDACYCPILNFYDYFITLAEYREQQINSILDD